MQAEAHNTSPLERRMDLAFATNEIESEVETRLKKLARTVRLHGFRPGKVPLKLVAQQYGGKVRQEVMADSLQRAFTNAVKEQNIRIAGYPRFEPKEGADGADKFEFTATYEIYPEVVLGELAQQVIKRPVTSIAEPEIDKTIEILRKQRTHWHEISRPAQSSDQVEIDYRGTLDGNPFEGGQAKAQRVVLGEGRLQPDFEANLIGMAPGESKTFDVAFPADYHGAQVAGKTVSFSAKLNQVAAPHLPAVDAEFAKTLGVASGDLQDLRADVKANLEREVSRRVQAKVKEQAMNALIAVAKLDVPNSLVEMETRRLMQNAMQDLQARGLLARDTALPPQAFADSARRRATLGLIIAEAVKRNKLEAKPEQVRAFVEDQAKSYENPRAMVEWYYQRPQMLQEAEAVVTEDNAVQWVMGEAKVEDVTTPFDELMGSNK
jgi:trigger factor